MKLTFLILLVTVFLFSACASLPFPSPPPTDLPNTASSTHLVPSGTLPAAPEETKPQQREHLVGIRQTSGSGEFYRLDSGEEFVPRGVNYVFVPDQGSYSNLLFKIGVYDPQLTRDDFQILRESGYNTVRVFLDHCSAGPNCIGDSDNQGLNPAYLDNIADLTKAAADEGLFILFTSNDLPDQGGYAELANSESGPDFAGYRNSYYLTDSAVTATRNYWRDLLTGLIAKDARLDHVLGWELLNEQWMFPDQPPLSLTKGEVATTTGTYELGNPEEKVQMVSDGLIHYIDEVKQEILLHDPTALVTMGFFVPELVAPGRYVETESLLDGSNLDFFDFHAYPGGPSLQDQALAFGMDGFTAKPIILGEYGAFRNTFPDLLPAAREITAWQAESCRLGFDGWLYWTYYPANAWVNDRTWSFTDEEGYFLNLLAPAKHPEPCQEIAITTNNLAYQKAVQASSALPNEQAKNAVDENTSTQWGSGSDAPQWIEIDLGAPHQINEIRLLVAQWPAGFTHHIVKGRGNDSEWIEIATFQENTTQGTWLVFQLPEALEEIRYLRVETLSSPSWVAWSEIQVFGN